jgi:hypothetical protein
MGDEILMKKLMILPLLALYLHSNEGMSSLVSEYEKMFTKIGQKRVGIDNREINRLNSPFITVEKIEDTNTTKTERFVLQALINKRAKINGRWYGVGEISDSVEIISIRNNEVVLKENNTKTRLKMRGKDAKFSIK